MKVYVVMADYCEDTVFCGVAIDEGVAEKIVECERNASGIKPDCVYIEERDTDDYLPLSEGVMPYEVIKYPDGSMRVKRTTLVGFRRNQVYRSRRGEKCLIFQVFAQNEAQALALAYELEKRRRA